MTRVGSEVEVGDGLVGQIVGVAPTGALRVCLSALDEAAEGGDRLLAPGSIQLGYASQSRHHSSLVDQ
ncbi:MAG: hypothetical protein HC881_15385 [Leptolyngbyaceae cyanobacterium SL_7_1]|nr:hypothetical protein [Leptolyngbyaceae cyanobacterium SL_7_1]